VVSCSGCDPQQALVSDLQYIEQTYFPSPAYMTLQGKPVVTNFDLTCTTQWNWTAASASLSTGSRPFFFKHNSGFTHVLSDGSFSWVMPTTTDYRDELSHQLLRTGMPSRTKRRSARRTKDQRFAWTSWGLAARWPAVRPNMVGRLSPKSKAFTTRGTADGGCSCDLE